MKCFTNLSIILILNKYIYFEIFTTNCHRIGSITVLGIMILYWGL